MSGKHKALGGGVFTGTFAVAMLVFLVGAFFLVQRFARGIGAVSNMSDGFPWGIWITYDVLVGTAFGCGGFAMAILVYILNKGQYHPLVRSAVMTSLFGYTLAGVSIFVDIGRYWNMLNVLIPTYWNLNSVLLEVALCIAAYIGILFLEFFPSFLEAGKGPEASRGYNKIMFILVAVGVLLPTMHQSSLGTLMVISGHKLSPLWQSSLLPFFNVLTAVTMGYGMVIFESYLSALAFKRPFETHLLAKLGGIVAALAGVYLVVRFGDLLRRGVTGAPFQGLNGLMFWVECALMAAPVALLGPKANREKAGTLCLAAFLLLCGGTVLRFNMYIVGFSPAPGWRYFPSVGEIFVTLAIISAEVMAYLIFVKKLPVLPEEGHA